MYDDADYAFVLQKMRLVNHNAHKRGATGDINAEEWLNKLRKHGQHCHYCGKPLTLKAVSVDHTIPLSRGGLHVIDNVEPVCQSCNHHKHARTPEEFMATPFVYSRQSRSRSGKPGKLHGEAAIAMLTAMLAEWREKIKQKAGASDSTRL